MISNEEIVKAASEYMDSFEEIDPAHFLAFIEGVKWYLKRLKEGDSNESD